MSSETLTKARRWIQYRDNANYRGWVVPLDIAESELSRLQQECNGLKIAFTAEVKRAESAERELKALREQMRWIPVEEKLPEGDDCEPRRFMSSVQPMTLPSALHEKAREIASPYNGMSQSSMDILHGMLEEAMRVALEFARPYMVHRLLCQLFVDPKADCTCGLHSLLEGGK